VARVALVLLLLGVAALGLSGRRHLDWSALSDAPGDTWVGLILIAMAAFIVVGSLQALARILRQKRDIDDVPVPDVLDGRSAWFGYFMAAVVIAAATVVVYLLLKFSADPPPPPRHLNTDPTVGVAPNARAGELSSSDKWALLGAVVIGSSLAVVFAVLRRQRELAETVTEDEEPTEQEGLIDAVAAAEVELDAHGDDTRAAIIAAYLAMERQLVAHGHVRRASDTPTDFLLRAMAVSRVSRGSATRLTDLFREARFSTHPMPETARADASRALARVADDLAHDAYRPATPGAGPRG
jgi:TRAP-type C4-dicarboxylate transport system permease small subunit